MKLKTFNLQIVRNLGNYESMRLGGEWSLDKDESLEQAMEQAYAELNATYEELKNAPKTEEERLKAEAQRTGRKVLKDNATIQQVLNAMNDGRADIEKVEKYYVMSDDTRNLLVKANETIKAVDNAVEAKENNN